MDFHNDLEKPEESAYLNCIRCGLCLAVCPTYREYLKETTSPRGRVALARKGLEGQLELSPNLIEQMYGCFACMACNDICPVGIRPADLALSMRHVQEQIKPAAWKRMLFAGLIPHPGRMEAATLPLRLYQMLGIRRLVYALGLMRCLPRQLGDLEAMLPHLPQRPLRHILPEVTEARKPAQYRVGFFLGCAQNLLFAEESAATVRVLARNGCTVITPREVECCGMPARGYGRPDLVQSQAKHNIAVFERQQVDVIVTDCATCGSTLKEYGALLKGSPDWAARAEAFSAKVRDVSEFLAEIPLEKPQGRINARVTYHDPCHLRRAQKVWKQPRSLLALIDGLELVELPEADWCCGSAGSQLITHYETSLKVMDRKLDNLAGTQAQFIASGCPGCQMQLITGVKRRGLDVQVVHPVTLLDQAYELGSSLRGGQMESRLIDSLIKTAGKAGVLYTPEDLAVYSYDGTFAEGRPDVIVLPKTTEQVSQIVKLAAEARVPLVPRGMGSGLAAGSIPMPSGGIVICLTRMNHILEIDAENATVRAEAGVVTSDLQAEVEKLGLFYPPDPSSIRHSTIGGNVACNAGGPRCLKYGVTGDYVLGLTVVLADGGILKTGGKPIKDVTGYDLNGLFTGSEGTLGLITEALLRLVAKPRYARTALAEFASLADASRTVNAILTAGIVPATLELMDQTALVCIEEAMHLGLQTDVEASLIIETDGADEQTVLREIEAAAKICQETGARSVKMAQDEAERSSLWKARRSISPSLARKAPNKLGEDITVPRNAIPEVVRRLRAISATYGLPIVIFGHAGDGNLHPNILFDKRQPEQWAKVEQMVGEIFATSLALGGTLSGEHGVGVLKRPYLERALGPLSVGVQRSIKQALDPMNILNPGKMFAA